MNLFQKLHEPDDVMPGADGNLGFLFAVGIPVLLAIIPSLIWGVDNGYWFFLFVGIGTGPIAAIQTCFKQRSVMWGAPVWIPWILFDIIFILSGNLAKRTTEERLLIIGIFAFVIIRFLFSKMTLKEEFGITKIGKSTLRNWRTTTDISYEACCKMPRVGFWWSKDEPDFPHPKDSVDKTWDQEERERVIAYLDQSYVAPYLQLGPSWCRLCIFNKTPQDIGFQDLTDGTWLYPEGFLHYIKKHQVKPPEGFLEHVRKTHYTMPELNISDKK